MYILLFAIYAKNGARARHRNRAMTVAMLDAGVWCSCCARDDESYTYEETSVQVSDEGRSCLVYTTETCRIVTCVYTRS